MKGSLLPLHPEFEVAGLSGILETLQSGERFCNKTFVSFLHSEELSLFFILSLLHKYYHC